MKKLVSLIAVGTLGVTWASRLKPLFANNITNIFKSNSKTKDIGISSDNENPFISKLTVAKYTTGISNIAVAPDGTIYTIAASGLFKSNNGKFTKIILPTAAGRPSVIAIAANGTIYVGALGLWKSTDGINFTQCNGFDVEGQFKAGIISIIITPKGVIDAGTYGAGIWKSTDDGINFSPIKGGAGTYGAVRNFVVDINGSIYAGNKVNDKVSAKDDGLWKSTDGINFTQCNGFSKEKIIYSLAVAVNGTIYVGADDGLYVSNDGVTYNKIDKINKRVSTLAVAVNGTIYVGTNDGLYVSNDGVTYNKIVEINKCVSTLAVDPNETIYVGTYIDETHGDLYKIDLTKKLLNLKRPDYYGNKYNGLVYNKETKIDIEDTYLSDATLDGKTQSLPKKDLILNDGKHILILTLKDKYKKYLNLFCGNIITGQITYNLWVKAKIDKKDINYSTNTDDTDLTDLSLGFVSNVGNTNNCPIIETKSKDGTGTHNASLNMNFDDILIDYPNSFYVQGTVNEASNDFTETGTHQKLSKNLSIKTDGIYHLYLVDTAKNTYDSYLELGENNWKLVGNFDNIELDRLKLKLNVNINLNDPKQLGQATGWLTNYDKFASDLFEKSLQVNGKGFDEEIKAAKKNDFTWFLKPLTYEPSNDTKFADGIEKDKLDKTIRDNAEKCLQDGLSKVKAFTENLNVDTKNIVNKSTLDSYTSWIKSYNDFINNHKDQWITEKVLVSGRGFATSEQIKTILDYINGLPFNNYLKHVEWTPFIGLTTSNDYKQFVDLDKLQKDTINWVNQNIPQIDEMYQQALKTAESGLKLHGYSINTLLNGKKLPQNQDEIEKFADGQSFHDWLQSKANIKFHGWQLTMGLCIGIPLFLIAIGIAWFVRKATDPRYNPFARGKKYDKNKKKGN